MIIGVAFCPQAPALVPDVGRGLEAELGPLRDVCRTAIRRVATPGTRVVVVGSGAADATFGPTSRGSFAGFGTELVVPLGSEDGGPVDLPPSLAVGAWLVRDALGPNSGAVGLSIASTGRAVPNLDEDTPTTLIVIGDGSARRSAKAPGYLDERSIAFDAAVSHALATGGGTLLRAAQGGDQGLLVAGVPVWDAVSELVGVQDWDAELLYDDAPFGVGYFVAAWTSPRG